MASKYLVVFPEDETLLFVYEVKQGLQIIDELQYAIDKQIQWWIFTFDA
jgi:hypothetical protein